MLQPLKAQIDAALSVGDVDAAVHLAYNGAAKAVSLGSEAPAVLGWARVHSVYVELGPHALAVYDDGTLEENGTYVSLAYQCQDVEPGQAEILAGNWNDARLGTSDWAVDSS